MRGVRVLLLGALVAAAAATPTVVRAQPMTGNCPSGASCATFYTSEDLTGNPDARDITGQPVCLTLGSLAGSVRNDTRWPLALYRDHCTENGVIATVPAGGKLMRIDDRVEAYTIVAPGP
jgi:hypothetical protein